MQGTSKIQIQNILKLNAPLILASQSPRRRQLLQLLGFNFRVQPSTIDETALDNKSDPAEYVRQLALAKAKKVAISTEQRAVVLGADTIVVLGDEILNKPKDKKDAFDILSKLSGKTHTVFTGIALVDSKTNKHTTNVKSTKVTFRELSKSEIDTYIATGSPMDKAGAYGIQDDFGAVFVSHIDGCYYNIVGLPLECLYTTLRDFLDN